MIIGIDIDGVWTDIGNFFMEYGTEYMYNKGLHFTYTPDYNFYISFGFDKMKNGKKLYNKFCEEMFKRYIEECKLRNSAVRVMDKLIKDGHQVVIITGRHLSQQIAGGINEKLVNEGKTEVLSLLLDTELDISGLIFADGNKREEIIEAEIDVLLEDNYSILEGVTDLDIKLFMFDSVYNANIGIEGCCRIYSWYHFLQEIDKLAKLG